VSADGTWALGNYECTARELTPAAVAAVEMAAPTSGEHVLDLGCGTGNAALLAAERGGRVTAVDPAARLLEVGAPAEREKAASRSTGAVAKQRTSRSRPAPPMS
jgi:predicted RNA methylase